jgi:hypothetical protein
VVKRVLANETKITRLSSPYNRIPDRSAYSFSHKYGKSNAHWVKMNPARNPTPIAIHSWIGLMYEAMPTRRVKLSSSRSTTGRKASIIWISMFTSLGEISRIYRIMAGAIKYPRHMPWLK